MNELPIFFASLASLVPMDALGFAQPAMGSHLDTLPLLAAIIGR